MIAIIAILLAVLVPALHRAREQGRRAACLSNVKQLTLAWLMYADENHDKNVNVSVRYTGEFRSRYEAHSLIGGIRYEFWGTGGL